ncbi:phosphonoacetaldehyde hydrolase [Brevundimonas sp. LM2]|uniref:phosphonoacetaldehyde hydrolase n=1 Tax=Brevundimonas sp. LM2 TaxID=1938605 RepID=UPI000983A3C5|nr:phosphonoacetaldehyde hydrolase [Brevundimonas sp. LM2]AQR61799.1 phosphonoacetaldehyde hydrolase [Brevundimonas sp. LM2]
MTSSIKAVIFDWAGTMIDFGSVAPVLAMRQAFAAEGVAVTDAEIRAHMGRAKRDHVAQILGDARVQAAWTTSQGAASTDADIDRLHDALEPLMFAAAASCADLIDGAADLAHDLRARGVKIGSTTGYTRTMMQAILPRAADQGYALDAVVCAGETLEGRPSPLMVWKALVEMGVWPARACVKVDDAEVGMGEGREAGCWTVGIAASGNGVGLTPTDLAALAPAERSSRVARAQESLLAAGAHAVVETVADLPAVLAEIERRIAAGETPTRL